MYDFRRLEKKDCSALVKNTLINTLILIRERNNQKAFANKHLNICKSTSFPNLNYQAFCAKCQVLFNQSAAVSTCLLCDDQLEKMNITESPCKVCTLGQPNYKNYEILNYERCKCQRPPDLLCLSSIRSVSCSVDQNINSDKNLETNQFSNIRTTASGINGSDPTSSSNNYMWAVKSPIPSTTWTCKRCTLLNSAHISVCEACEAPYSPDFNSNVTPSVIIKVNKVL